MMPRFTCSVKVIQIWYLVFFILRGANAFSINTNTGNAILSQSIPISSVKMKDGPLFDNKQKRLTTSKLQLSLMPEITSSIIPSLLKYSGDVPIALSVGINGVLFGALRSKLNTMLTPSGFWHAFALGCGLWKTLGWRGWSICVMYLFLGQAVTKLRVSNTLCNFCEKD